MGRTGQPQRYSIDSLPDSLYCRPYTTTKGRAVSLDWEDLDPTNDESWGEGAVAASRHEHATQTCYTVDWDRGTQSWRADLLELRFGEELNDSGWHAHGFMNPSAARKAAEEHDRKRN